MSKEIEFSKDIKNILNKTYKEERKKVEDAIQNFADNIVISLKNNSPKRTGKYARSWKITKEYASTIIHNTRYRLTHLLEDGFINVKGRYVSARPHIKKSFDENLLQFLENLKK